MKYLLFILCAGLLLTLAAAPFSTATALYKTPTPEPEITGEATEEASIEIEADEGPLAFTGYQVNEARFNPNVEKPAALNIMASMDFQNTSKERLEVRSPRFSMTINEVEWTDLASTDFQIGRLQPGAQQSIELQSLLIMRRATDEQQAVLEDIKAGLPVDLEINGTILVYPGGKEQTLHVTIRLQDIVLPHEWDTEE